MDSKQYMLAMAVLDSLKANQQTKKELNQFEMKVAENERVYQRNKKDQEAIRNENRRKNDDNALFRSLNTRVGQVNKDWTNDMIGSLKKDIDSAKGMLDSNTTHFDEYEVMYESLSNNLSNQETINNNYNTANSKYDEFENKVLDLYNLDNPQQMSDSLKTVLNLEKSIINDYRDNLSSHNKSLFRNLSKKDLPRVKSMLTQFDAIDSNVTDNKFTPDIKNFTASTTTIEVNGQLQTITQSPAQLKSKMIQAYNFFKAGDLQNAQKFYNQALVGYKPVAPSKSSGTINTGLANTQYKGVFRNGVFVPTEEFDSSAGQMNYKASGSNMGIGVIPEDAKQFVDRDQLQKIWGPKLANWKTDGISDDPLIILSEKLTKGFFDEQNPKFANINDFRAEYKKQKQNGGEMPLLVTQMLKQSGYNDTQGPAAFSNALLMLEDPVNLSSVHYNIANFNNTFQERAIDINKQVANQYKFEGVSLEEEMFNLFQAGVDEDAAIWDSGKIKLARDEGAAKHYKSVYLGGGEKRLKSNNYFNYKHPTKELPSAFHTDRIDKAVKFVGLMTDDFMGTEGQSVTDADLKNMTTNVSTTQAKATRDHTFYNWLSKLHSSPSLWADYHDDIRNEIGDFDSESDGNSRIFHLAVKDFHINYNKKYYDTEVGFLNVKARISQKLRDGIPLGAGIDYLPGGEQNASGANLSRYFKKNANGILTADYAFAHMITPENSKNLEFPPGVTVIAPGVINTPYGELNDFRLIDYVSDQEAAKVIGLPPWMKEDPKYKYLFGYFDKKSQMYKTTYDEDFPLYKTGK